MQGHAHVGDANARRNDTLLLGGALFISPSHLVCLTAHPTHIRNPVLNGNGNPKYLRITCSTVTVIDQKWTFEKLYEAKGIKPKLCSYRPVEGKSSFAHLFEFVIKNGNVKKYTNIKK